MKVAVVVSQRGKYIHRVVGQDGRFLGIVNAGHPADGRIGRPPAIWYATHRDGHRTTNLPNLDSAILALWKERT